MEQEALATTVTSLMGRGITTVPTLFYEQSATPYIVHHVGTSVPDNLTEDMTLRTYEIFIRVVVGHITANYSGDNEELTDEIIPVLEDYFLKHPMLTTDTGAFATEPTYIFPEGIDLGDTTGIKSFEIGGIGSIHVGEELSLTIPVIRTLEQS
jgi:hypothetical protein